MRLSDDDRKSIDRRVGGTASDGALAVNCVTAFLTAAVAALNGRMGEMHYEIDARFDNDETLFAVRFKRGVAILTNDMIDAVMNQSRSRVIGVAVDRDGHIVVEMLRENHLGAHQRRHYVPPRKRKKREVPCDYERAGVTSPDDRDNIDQIVELAYHMRERLPASMQFWYEKIRAHGTGAMKAGVAIPLTRALDIDDDDASESLAATGDVVGFSLCFSNVSCVDGAFLQHLHANYPSLVVSSFVWIDVPASIGNSPVLVVNIRAACTVADDVRRRLVAAIPRGTCPPTKRVRRSAAAGGGK